MLNHARALLANLTVPQVQTLVIPGDELGPPGYVQLSLPDYLNSLRSILFGLSPDAIMLNYRLQQFLPLLHSTFLEPYIFALDPRVTYDLRATTFVADTLFVPQVLPMPEAMGRISFIGSPTAPDVSGQTSRQYQVELQSGATLLSITILNPVRTWTDQIQPASLRDSGYSIHVTSCMAGSEWDITVVNRPQYDPGALVASVRDIDVLHQLFGSSPQPPYDTFANIWYDQDETPLRLSALLLAIIYRVEDIRVR